jgi:hypothetical protein
VSPDKFTSLSAINVRIFKGPVKAIWRSTVQQLKWDFTRPNNLVHKPCILFHIPLKLVTKLHVLIRIIFIHGMLQPSNVSFPPTSFQNAVYTCPANSYLLRTSYYGFSGDREKCCNTTSKDAGLVSLCGFPDNFLCTPCIVPSDLKLSQMRLLLVLRVSVVGGSSTIHIYTQTTCRTQRNRITKQYITIRIHKHNNKNT